jgi:hypothetical protein
MTVDDGNNIKPGKVLFYNSGSSLLIILCPVARALKVFWKA